MEIISVIIVNYNGKRYLPGCLGSLKNQSCPDLEIIVVDDCSTDGSADFIKTNYPLVRLARNAEEKLFCACENIGIQMATGNHILFLETDTVLEEDYIEEVNKAFSLDEKIGMAMGKILRPDRKTIDSAGLFLGRSRRPIDRGFNQKDTGQFDNPGCVFGVNLIAGMFRRDFLESIKFDDQYLDEDFGILYEDLDVCWRGNRLGWKAYYAPRAVAYHVRGGTTQTRKPPLAIFEKYYFAHLAPMLQFHLVKNRYMVIIKNDSLPGFIRNLPLIFLYEIKLWAYVALFRPKLLLKIASLLRYAKLAFRKRRVLSKGLVEASMNKLVTIKKI